MNGNTDRRTTLLASSLLTCSLLAGCVEPPELAASEAAAYDQNEPDLTGSDHEQEGPLVRSTQFSVSEAQLEDLALIAKEQGWTLAQAVERVGWQPRFVEAVERARARYPDTFAGAVIRPGEAHAAVILFKHEVPPELLADTRLAGVEIEFVGGRGYSEAQLLEQSLRVHRALRSSGFEHSVSSYDVETGRIEVTLPIQRFARTKVELRASLPEAARADNIEFELVEDWADEEFSDVHGGSSGAGCTAGVAVESGGVRGMLTAGHCPDGMVYDDQEGGSHIGIFAAEHLGIWGDFQWDTFDIEWDPEVHDPSHFFFADEGNQREAWSVRSAVEGMYLCRFGGVTGKQCDTVRKVNVTGDDHEFLVEMDHCEAAGGDSGGPWYYGNDVYGVAEGRLLRGFEYHDLWSQLAHVDEALGLSVILCERDTCEPWECGEVYVGCGTTLHCGACQPCLGAVCPNGSCCPEDTSMCSGGEYCGFDQL